MPEHSSQVGPRTAIKLNDFKLSILILVESYWFLETQAILSRASVARGCRAQLFVRGKLIRLFMRVRVQHRSAAAARGCLSTLSVISRENAERYKTVSSERAQHTEIPLPLDKEPLRFGSARANFARGSVRSAARGNLVSTLRGKATNISSRGSRAQLVPGFKVTDFQLFKMFPPPFMEPVRSFPCTQEPATLPCPQPHSYSLHYYSKI
jgi:hypothetical protein